MSRILRLPSDVSAQIHSSKSISSLEGVLLGLLENSLDAGASKIEASVNFRRGNCCIEDDGAGILLQDFEQDGGLTKAYHTSKHYISRSQIHGSSGTFLASLGALSLLEITSKHSQSAQHATIIVHHNKVISRHIPSPPRLGLSLCLSHGTRVTVRDLFGNTPVRVKHRALLAECGSKSDRDWLELERLVVALLLAWPRHCKIRIRDDENARRIIKIDAAQACSTNHKSPKETQTERIVSILNKSSLVPSDSRSTWIPVSAKSSNLMVSGVINLDPAPTRRCQFISVGVHPCSLKKGYDELYSQINKTFAQSTFAHADDGVARASNMPINPLNRKRDGQFLSPAYHKRVDKWPMIALNIDSIDLQEERKILNHHNESFMESVLEILGAVVYKWLMTNHFRPSKLSHRSDNVYPMKPVSCDGSELAMDKESIRTNHSLLSAKRAASADELQCCKKRLRNPVNDTVCLAVSAANSNNPFSLWSRIKSGSSRRASSRATTRLTKSSTSAETTVTSTISPLHTGESAEATRIPDGCPRTSESARSCSQNLASFRARGGVNAGIDKPLAPLVVRNSSFSAMPKSPRVNDHDNFAFTEDAIIQWSDAANDQVERVNARAGIVLPSRPHSSASITGREAQHKSQNAECTLAIDTSKSAFNRPLRLTIRGTAGSLNGIRNEQVPGFLKDWSNPVFAKPSEPSIPTISDDASQGKGLKICGQHDAAKSPMSISSTHMTAQQLSKEMVTHAQVINQVDRKFILCRMRQEMNAIDGILSSHSSVLVMVDQHAASERVILEALLDELCAKDDDSNKQACCAAGLLTAGIRCVVLDTQIHFDISAQECALFGAYAQHFANWGILYKVNTSRQTLSPNSVASSRPQNFVAVHALPTVIAERCVSVPRLVIDMLRTEVWHLADDGVAPTTCGEAATKACYEKSWVARTRTCPKGLLDLLSSRACRSAVMFNDALSIDECERLLAQLGDCVFPFICAHGRVSMVPVVELPVDS